MISSASVSYMNKIRITIEARHMPTGETPRRVGQRKKLGLYAPGFNYYKMFDGIL